MDLMLFERFKTATGVAQTRALNEIVLAETSLVNSCVRAVIRKRPYTAGAAETEDLVQHGLIALVATVKKWDPLKGPWANYARKWVTKAIHRAMPDQATVRVPEKRRVLTQEQVREDRAVQARHGRKATAEELHVDPRTLEQYRESLPLRVAEDSMSEYAADAPSPETKILASRAMNVLDPRAQRIVHALFVEEKSLDEVAAEEGFSKFWVFEQKEAALKKMRAHLG